MEFSGELSKYQIIYADPPWQMGRKSNGRVLVPEYPTMSIKKLFGLPVGEIANENCAMLMWSTNSMLSSATDLMRHWGFRYVGVAFCWVKTSQKTGEPNCRMSGNYTLQGVELCLLGIRGRMPTKDRTVRQVLMSPREYHSKKPDIIRDEIVRLFGDMPRIELFARQKIDGWDCWGNEVEIDMEFSGELI